MVSFSSARRSRTPLPQLIADHLRPEPTLLALLTDRYTSESSLRPFAPLADKLDPRMHVLVFAEWPQAERERDGEALLRSLGVSREAWPMLLRDEDDTRFAVVLHRGKPVALINLFFRELPQGSGGAEEQELRAWEDEALRKLESLLSRLSPLPAEASLPAPKPPPPDPGPSRDRFELIELD
ncbi:MAG TPA: hypothetical protein VE964_12995 [Myxococcales bacterium]|nr:hypothetical protein [Myxococcales bacterium]